MYSKSSKQRRFAPYTQQRPIADRATLQAEVQRLRNLKVQLDNHNAEGNIVTYDDAVGGWVDWQRPVRVMKSGAMTDVAASGFHTLGDDFVPPQCPHVEKPDRTMTLHLQRMYGINKKVDFFCATSHACHYTVVVPRLNPPLVTQDPEVIAEQLASVEVDGEDSAEAWEEYHYDQDHLQPPFLSPSEDEVAELVQLQQLPTPPTSLSLSRKYRDNYDNIFINPRVTPTAYTPLRSNTPSARPKGVKGGNSFFEKSVADARASSAYPEQHPAADLKNTHRVLQPYDSTIFPNCLNRTFAHLQYMSTNIGRVIRELHSSIGIRHEALLALISDATTCSACRCIFSVDGFNAHIENNTCRNCTSEILILRKVVTLDDVAHVPLRTFAETPSAKTVEFIDLPAGAALMEWNSRIGVPQDVWAMISTAYVQCKTCGLCRSFHGDWSHRDTDGDCLDVGEAVVTPGEEDDDSDNHNAHEPCAKEREV
ncbi:hypothetical protein H0H93_012313 [Arthromyces matolae]|nr:hypothetical protein H0H93_012313 [Arthromyces matolae]